MTLSEKGGLCLPVTLVLAGLLSSATCLAQKTIKQQVKADEFPELVMTPISGASKLGKPQLIKGETGPVMAEGSGWAAPAFFDYDGDGKKDLIIGEFTSGTEGGGHNTGNFMRVYRNKGDEKMPRFSDDFNYLEGFEDLSNGTPLSVYNTCCMAFTPRIVDLNGDGLQDIVSGQYSPGFITWFRNSAKGYLPGESLDEEGDAILSKTNFYNYDLPVSDITGPNYWTYSAVAFLDADGDGDQDMITGGGALRLSENTGTREKPQFGLRKMLTGFDNQPLRLFHTPSYKVDTSWGNPPDSGGYNLVPYTDDWNNDGVVDLLVTSVYAYPGISPITYFEGVQSDSGIRFKQGVALFNAKNGGKELPGSYTNLCIADWNSDGIKDLIIGTNVPTIAGKFDATLAWSWEANTGTLKMNPGDYDAAYRAYIKKTIESAANYQRTKKFTDAQMKTNQSSTAEETYRHHYVDKKYETLSHKGYIYVMLGQKEK